MSKKQISEELTNLLAKSLRHKIGSILNKNEVYAQRYAKDADIFFRQAEKINDLANWNSQDKLKIKETLKRKLRNELKEKEFIPDEKYDLMDKEIENALSSLDLN